MTTKPKRIVLEWCCSVSSFFGMTSADSKGFTLTCYGEVTTTDDGFHDAQFAVNDAPNKPMIPLWSAILCTGGSPWQNSNKHEPGGMEKIKEQWD